MLCSLILGSGIGFEQTQLSHFSSDQEFVNALNSYRQPAVLESYFSGGVAVRLVPNIRYGTEKYPEKVARRLRAVNITTWSGAAIIVIFGIERLFDPMPVAWRVAYINWATAPVLVAVPLLHRLSPVAAPLFLVLLAYAFIFTVNSMLGTGAATYLYMFTATALGILFIGPEYIFLTVLLGVVAVGLIITLNVTVPHDRGIVSPAALFFGHFVTNVIASSAILYGIIFYAVRQFTRAEERAEREHQRSESLLMNILPPTIAERLKDRPDIAIADAYPEASILFADMAGSTAAASTIAPANLVKFLNEVFTAFDTLVERHGLEKIKTTGDGYVVVSGVPVPRPDHATALVQFAVDMLDAALRIHDPNGHSLSIRIGIASGPVVGGVVGTKKFFYDVWGDAVNVASRMESTGVPGRIQVSSDTYERVKAQFELESRGNIDVKGKGRMTTWLVIGRRKGETKRSAASLSGDHCPTR
jgi:adenylate cyclase